MSSVEIVREVGFGVDMLEFFDAKLEITQKKYGIRQTFS